MANAIHLQATLDAVLAHPEHWRQDSWHCGTSHCFAGFAEMIRLAENPTEKCSEACYCQPDRDGLQRAALANLEATQKWLGLTDEEWSRVVHVGNSLEELKRKVCRLVQESQETTE
jgi:hypothetical protein